MTFVSTQIELSQLVRHVASLFEPEARERGMTLSVELPQSLAAAVVDHEKSERFLVNLLSSTLAVVPEGGTILVTLGTEGAGAVVTVGIDCPFEFGAAPVGTCGPGEDRPAPSPVT